jgi:chromosome segregation ATPase
VAAETALLEMTVERDRLQSKTEQLETEITERTEAKAVVDEQCSALREECDELRGAKEELVEQLQVMTDERDAARAKEEEYFEIGLQKDEELMDTNNGYVYLTERLQEKEEEMEQFQEQIKKLQESNDILDERCQKLSSDNLSSLAEQQKLRGKLAEEEKSHQAAQDRYMKLIKTMGGGEDKSATTASTPETTQKAGEEQIYEPDFDDED